MAACLMGECLAQFPAQKGERRILTFPDGFKTVEAKVGRFSASRISGWSSFMKLTNMKSVMFFAVCHYGYISHIP